MRTEFDDATRERARERLEGVAQLLALDEGNARFRHDLRNRLAAVRNAAYYLERKTQKSGLWEQDARMGTFFALITSELTSADSLIGMHTQLGALSTRVSASMPEAVELALAFERLPSTHPFELRGAETPVPVLMHLEAVGLGVAALLRNAVEAQPQGGPITLTVAPRNGGVELLIEDGGPGVDAGLQGSLFLRPVSNKPGRTGHGLRFASRVAALHKGLVERCADTPRTTFRLWLPGPEVQP